MQITCGWGTFQPTFLIKSSYAGSGLHVQLLFDSASPTKPHQLLPLQQIRLSEEATGVVHDVVCNTMHCFVPANITAKMQATLELTLHVSGQGSFPLSVTVTLAGDPSVLATSTYYSPTVNLAPQVFLQALDPPHSFYKYGTISVQGHCFPLGPAVCVFAVDSVSTLSTEAVVVDTSRVICQQPTLPPVQQANLQVLFGEHSSSNWLQYRLIGPPTHLRSLPPEVLLRSGGNPPVLHAVLVDANDQQVSPDFVDPPVGMLCRLNGTALAESHHGTDGVFVVEVQPSARLMAGTVPLHCTVPSIQLSSTITVEILPGVPTQLYMIHQPSSIARPLQPLAQQPWLGLQDMNGNIVTHLAGSIGVLREATVVASFEPTPEQAMALFAPFAADGVARFMDLSLQGLHQVKYVLHFSFFIENYVGLEVVPTVSTPITFNTCGGGNPSSYGVNGTAECRLCPLGAVCDGDRIMTLPGYWSSDPSFFVLRCPSAVTSVLPDGQQVSNCHGMKHGTCRTGFAGPMCTACAEGWGQTLRQWCDQCWPWTASVALLVITVASYCLVVTFFTYASLSLDERNTFSSVWRLLINHLQTTSRLPEILVGVYPQLLARLFSITRFASEFTLEVSYMPCGLGWTRQQKFIAYMALPGCLTLVPTLLVWVYQLIPDKTPRENFPYDLQMALEPLPEVESLLSKRMRFQRVFNLFHTFAACLCAVGLLNYFTVTQHALEWLRCESPLRYASQSGMTLTQLPEQWLAADPSVACSGDQYFIYFWAAFGCFLAYSLFFLVVPQMLVASVGVSLGPKAQNLFSFVVGVYRMNCWWWESVVTLRKLLLVFIIVFVHEQRLRAYLALLVLGGAFVAHILAWPFVEAKYNKAEWAALLSTILSLLLGLCLMEVCWGTCEWWAWCSGGFLHLAGQIGDGGVGAVKCSQRWVDRCPFCLSTHLNKDQGWHLMPVSRFGHPRVPL